jgi:hypothetical protein
VKNDAAGTAPAGGTTAATRSRLLAWINLGAVALTLGSVVLGQATLRRDCLRVQARYGFQGCVRDGSLEGPAFDWTSGARREALLMAIEAPAFLWPFASGEDVRRGAAQLLFESANLGDDERLLKAVAVGRLDPCFCALHCVLATHDSYTRAPPEIIHALDGSAEEQLFACTALAMLTGRRADHLAFHHYDPLPPRGAMERARAIEQASLTLFKCPLADAVAWWKRECAGVPCGRPPFRPSSDVIQLLAECPRSWSLG